MAEILTYCENKSFENKKFSILLKEKDRKIEKFHSELIIKSYN